MAVQKPIVLINGELRQLAGGDTVTGQIREIYVQSSQPTSTGQPYIWVQTGLPNGGITLWVDDGT